MKFPGEKFKKNILLAPRCMCVTLYIDRCIALILCEISSPSAYVLYTVHSRVEWSNTFCDFWNRTQCYQSGIFQKFNVKHFLKFGNACATCAWHKGVIFFLLQKITYIIKIYIFWKFSNFCILPQKTAAKNKIKISFFFNI